MTREIAMRAMMLYLPLSAALLAGAAMPRRPRQFPACLLSLLWVAVTLIVAQRLNLRWGWWSYSGEGPRLAGMPLEMWLGWTILWGALPQLAWPRLGVHWCVALLTAFDVSTMPLLTPVLRLQPHWLLGEAVCLALVLLPALLVARWTLLEERLGWRAALQVATSGMLFLFLVPEIVFAMRPGHGWSALLAMPRWERQIALQLVCVLALPGVSAVQEFVQRGRGTPIPYDPPKLLVTSGIYRYCANPMQLSCAVAMFVWADILRNAWLLLPAAISVVYSAGIARWDEEQDLEVRFGAALATYRAGVPAWWMRWLPFHTGEPARLYIARTCGPCSELRRWLEARRPLGLVILDAESLPQGSLRRMTYVSGDDANADADAEDGVRALGRALEHLHLGWALCGMALRLPVLWWCVQTVMDAAGLGPQMVMADRGAVTSCELR